MKRSRKSDPAAKRKLLSRLSLFFFDRPVLSILIWLAIIIFGIASYTTLLKREGFPTINIPYSMVSGSYLVNDPAKVDNDIAKPLSEIITKQDKVQAVDAQSGANFFSITIQYADGTDANAASKKVEEAVRAAHVLPAAVKSEFKPLSPGIDQQGHDMLVAFYAGSNSKSTEDIYSHATKAAQYLKNKTQIPLAKSIEAVDPFARGINPETGQAAISQQIFDRYGAKGDSSATFHKDVVIGIKGTSGFDALELDSQLQSAIDKLNASSEFAGYHAVISYSPAPDIKDQISGLQHSLIDALVAILIVSAILIAIRAALITVAAMILVLMTTLGVLYLIGYTLNTITLFSLILCLSLIVDDTIIMVEAIDAERRHNKNARDTVSKATGKISRAMLAATITATVGFLPLLFVSGILGSFIKAIPVTVVTSLIVSLFVALSFIPFLSRFLLLRRGQLGHGEGKDESLAHRFEASIANALTRPLLWARRKPKRLFGLGITAFLIGIGFIVAGGFLFQKVTFDIFPADKDGDIIGVHLNFDSGTSIDETQAVADRADSLMASKLGANFKSASYYNSGNAQSADLTVVLLSFKNRSVTSPQLAKEIESAFTGFKGAQVKVATVGVGPPVSAFNVYIETDNRQAAYAAAKDISLYLRQKELVRLDGSKAHFKTVTISDPSIYSRSNNKAYIAVSGEFDATDTSTLVTLAQDAVKSEFNDKKMATYDLKASNLTFNIGTQEDFQKSFNKLAYAFPLLLLAIFILLATQFRSLLQPIFIFMAIPFSLFGITLGLLLTHNAFSFFTLLGFFALLGLSLKNTILLTDYANQARNAGAGHVEAITISLKERFRPLVATSLTAVISLVPLYLSNPFWEGLTVTLMFGLLSSTLLVLTVFPYYYLGGEYLRARVSRKGFFLWLLLNAVVIVLVAKLLSGFAGMLVFVALNIALIIYRKYRRRR
jgi:multidrug efflux pump subunit AcrB